MSTQNEKPIIFSTPMVQAILNGSKTQSRRVIKPQPLKPHWSGSEWIELGCDDTRHFGIKCPYGQVGMNLWVREAHYCYGHWIKNGHTKTGKQKWTFGADDNGVNIRYMDNPPRYVCKDKGIETGYWKRPSIYMPRWASRILLEITGIEPQKLQEISEKDIKNEGLDFREDCGWCQGGGFEYIDTGNELAGYDYRRACRCLNVQWVGLWDSINGKKRYGYGYRVDPETGKRYRYEKPNYSWESNPFVWKIEFKVVTSPWKGKRNETKEV